MRLVLREGHFVKDDAAIALVKMLIRRLCYERLTPEQPLLLRSEHDEVDRPIRRSLSLQQLRDAEERRDAASVVLGTGSRPTPGDGVIVRSHEDVPVRSAGSRDLRHEVR